MATPSGKLLGRYEIVAEIGRGAMGAVYKARDPKIGRSVAIKTILLRENGVQGESEFRERFFVEARAAGRLLHPGIVAVFDVGEEPETGNPYIVMEYIAGPSLAELLAEKTTRLALDDALRIAMEVAEALDYAHGHGVVHRDIKPANILLTKTGQAKISDFGIAQLDLSHLTLPGHALGTPAYMSPEQLDGQRVDGRSDLFSLGAVLYSAVTGFNPFQGSSAASVIFKVANRDPLQATALAPELPPELDAVITRALAKDPAERYQRGRELARDLRELRKRVGAAHNGEFRFSPPEGHRKQLDAATNDHDLASSPAALNLSESPSPPPDGVRNRLAFFSLPRVEAGASILLLVGAIVLSFFALRQLRTPSSTPKSVVENVSRASPLESAQQKRSGTANEATADTHSDVSVGDQNQAPPDTDTEVDSAVVATAPPAVSKPKALPAAPQASVSPELRKRLAGGVKKTGDSAEAKAIAPPATSGSPAQPSGDAAQGMVAAPAIADSNVEIRVENHFSDATLAIWIDDRLVYEHPLHGGHKKRLILLGGGAKETVTIPVSAGKHTLRVEVKSATEQYDQTRSVAGDFPKDGETILSVSFEKRTKEMRLTLGATGP